MGALGFFKDDFNYKKMSEKTVALITHQGEGSILAMPEQDDLFHEDVRLVAKDGKLFYLPHGDNKRMD